MQCVKLSINFNKWNGELIKSYYIDNQLQVATNKLIMRLASRSELWCYWRYWICIVDGDQINRFNTATFLFLFQARTRVSNVIVSWYFLCSVRSVKIRGDCWFCWNGWNWWFLFIIIHIVRIVSVYVLICKIAQIVL